MYMYSVYMYIDLSVTLQPASVNFSHSESSVTFKTPTRMFGSGINCDAVCVDNLPTASPLNVKLSTNLTHRRVQVSLMQALTFLPSPTVQRVENLASFLRFDKEYYFHNMISAE